MLDLLANMGAGLFSHTVESGTNYVTSNALDAESQNRSFNYNQKSAKAQQIRELQNLQNSPSAYVQGLKRAGINPALLASGQIPVGQSTALPVSGTAHMSPGTTGALQGASAALMVQKQMEMTDSEIDLNRSQTHKNEAEAKEKDIENSHKESYDKALSSSFQSMLTEMKDSTENPYMKGFLEEFLFNSENIDMGVFRAFNDTWFGLSQKERDRELDYIVKEMDKKVLSMQYSNGAAEALADMPKAQRFQIYRNMALMSAQIASLNAETSLTEDKRSAIKASIEKLGQETLSILHHDPAAMWNAGELSSLGVMLGYDGIKAGMVGAGYAVGSAAVRGKNLSNDVKAIGPAAANLGGGTLKTAKPRGMSPEVYSQVVSKAKSLAGGDKVKEAQLIDKLVRHWHKQYGD